MIAFEIELNGESLGTAGADDLSVLSAIVNAVGKLGSASSGADRREDHYVMELTVGGLTSRAGGQDEHLDWIERTLKPGDAVTVRLIETETADSPIGSMPVPADGNYQRVYEESLPTNREPTGNE